MLCCVVLCCVVLCCVVLLRVPFGHCVRVVLRRFMCLCLRALFVVQFTLCVLGGGGGGARVPCTGGGDFMEGQLRGREGGVEVDERRSPLPKLGAKRWWWTEFGEGWPPPWIVGQTAPWEPSSTTAALSENVAPPKPNSSPHGGEGWPAEVVAGWGFRGNPTLPLGPGTVVGSG